MSLTEDFEGFEVEAEYGQLSFDEGFLPIAVCVALLLDPRSSI